MERKSSGAVSVPGNNRSSDIELLRIVAMILIVAHHYVVNSDLLAAKGPVFSHLLAPKSVFTELLGCWGKSAINSFVIISGYYMCRSKITVKKFAKLFLEWMFYRLVINAVLWITGVEPFTAGTFFREVLPITNIASNFVPCYMLFYLTIPFLNRLIEAMDQRQHAVLVVFLLAVYAGLGTFHAITFNYVSWFIVLYFAAAYIRLYPNAVFSSKKIWGKALVCSLAVSALSVIGCAFMKAKTGSGLSPYEFLQDSNTLLAFSNGLCAFLFFKNLNMKYSPAVNRIAASTFGVLLIHTAGNMRGSAMKNWLWNGFLKNAEAYARPLPAYLLHAAASILGVYLVCTLIDMLRIRFLEKPFFALWDKKQATVSKRLDHAKEKFFSMLGL